MINRLLQKVDVLNQRHLLIYIISSSMLLAAWMQHIQHGWINPDSVLYLEQGRLFALGKWSEGFNIFKWPLYGASIGLTHKLTSLPIHVSAQLLNMLFFGLATASFLHIIKLAGGSNRTLFLGALLLFSSQYIVGDVLEMLMRDEGFWAFYLTALVFFIRYMHHNKIQDAILWQLFIIVATLFRIEAILYLLLLPIIYVLTNNTFSIKVKFKHLLNAYSVSLILGLSITVAILSQPELSIANFGRLQEAFSSNLFHEITQKFFMQADIMSSEVLGRYLKEFAVPGLLLTFIYVIFSKVLTTTGLISTGLALLDIKKIEPPSTSKRILLITCLIAAITMALIIVKVFVLSGRYVVALAWILLIFASFYLTTLSYKNNKKSRFIYLALCCILSLGIIKNTLPKGSGYNYMQEAVGWVKQQPDASTVFYEDSRLRYFASEAFIGAGVFELNSIKTSGQKKSSYNYIVLKFGKNNQHKQQLVTESLSEYKEVKRFYSRKKRKYCAIYKQIN